MLISGVQKDVVSSVARRSGAVDVDQLVERGVAANGAHLAIGGVAEARGCVGRDGGASVAGVAVRDAVAADGALVGVRDAVVVVEHDVAVVERDVVAIVAARGGLGSDVEIVVDVVGVVAAVVERNTRAVGAKRVAVAVVVVAVAVVGAHLSLSCQERPSTYRDELFVANKCAIALGSQQFACLTIRTPRKSRREGPYVALAPF